MLTLKLFQLSLIDTARACTELVTAEPHFRSPLINIQFYIELLQPLAPMVCAHTDLEVTFSTCSSDTNRREICSDAFLCLML